MTVAICNNKKTKKKTRQYNVVIGKLPDATLQHINVHHSIIAELILHFRKLTCMSIHAIHLDEMCKRIQRESNHGDVACYNYNTSNRWTVLTHRQVVTFS